MTQVPPIYCLLVDDLAENLLSLEALLKRDGLVLLKARSGPEALELLLEHEIALALLDVQMPGMDGFELAELMRGTARTQRVPIIFLTAGSDDYQRRFRGYEAGAVDFLHKPIDTHMLRSKAEVFFALYRQQQQLQASLAENARLLEESRQYATALKEADQRKDEFLANMSHEIRTPMNAVVGLATILSMTEPLSDKQREFISTLRMSADALLNLINDLLDISKIESSKVELEQVPFCLAKMADEAARMSRIRAEEKGLTLTIEQDANIRHQVFLGDSARLRQVLLNLCTNAIKFTDKGSVTIRLRGEKLEANRATVVLEVTDTGIGIAPEKLDRVFQKFEQADSSISRKYGGTGLGLAISRMLVELMGGRISVRSKLGEGSTFSVMLPMAFAPSEQATPSTTAEDTTTADREAGRKPRVLLVEDHAPNVLVARAFLENFGYDIEVVSNGEDAVRRAADAQYAAVLMDVQMHGMNGYEATQAIREAEAKDGRPRQPIMGMTAHALLGDRERCIAAGMDDYITKPFVPDDLREKLATLAA